jgi:4-amino-4-deoxy-L-arabinose transferase-like glycosyltransferase
LQRRPSRSRTLAIGVLALVAIAPFYFFDLSHTPVYFGGDEAHFGGQAYSIARTGRSLDGEFLPLFVKLGDPLGDHERMPWGDTWYQPFLFYLVALLLKFVPLTEAWVRAPTAFIGGVLTPILMYVVAFRLLQNRVYAAAAAVLLALSPVQVILSRQALDYICPLPFVLAWLWSLSVFEKTGSIRAAFAGGLILGVGCYSYIASWMQMPICLLLSWLVFYRLSRPAGGGKPLGLPIAFSAAGFALPVVVLAVPWLWLHPEMLQQTITRYRLPPDGGPAPSLLRVYLSFFNPYELFVTGGPILTTATGRIGSVLLPLAVLGPVGVYALWRRRQESPLHLVLLLGLFLAPVAATLKREMGMIQREMIILVFAVLIAAFGLTWLQQSARRWVRLGAFALLAVVPLQFGWFFYDYLGHYKRRSAFYYDSVVFGDIADYLIDADAATGVPAIYLSTALDDAAPKWRFYAAKRHREQLLSRTQYFTSDGYEFEAAPPGSVMVVIVENAKIAALIKSGRWSLAKIMYDIDRREAAAILRKGS